MVPFTARLVLNWMRPAANSAGAQPVRPRRPPASIYRPGGSSIRRGQFGTANSYRNSLQEAVAHHCQTVAFPSISTGVYHFSLQRAAKIAVDTVRQFTKKDPRLAEVIFVGYDSQTAAAYRAALQD